MLFIAMVVVIIGVPVWKVTSDVFAVLAAVVFTISIYWRPMNFSRRYAVAPVIAILVIVLVNIIESPHKQNTNEAQDDFELEIRFRPLDFSEDDFSEDLERSIWKPQPQHQTEDLGILTMASIAEPFSMDTEKIVPAKLSKEAPKDVSSEPEESEPETDKPPSEKYPGVPIVQVPTEGNMYRLLTDNGRKRRDQETEYEGQVRNFFLQAVPFLPHEFLRRFGNTVNKLFFSIVFVT